MSYSATVLTDSPLVYYRLGDTSGPNAVDSSGNSLTGLYYVGTFTFGVAGLLAGDADTAVSFVGNTSCTVNTPVDAVFSFGTGDFTFELWIETTQSTGGTYIFMGEDGSAAWWFGQVSGKLFLSAGGTSAAGATAVNDGAVHHIAVTRTSGVVQLYLDGAADGSPVTISGAVGNATVRVGIGGFELSGGFNVIGTLDEAAIYGTALSAGRIAAHYAAGTGGGGALAAGTATTSSVGNTIATVVVGNATGGTSPYTYQWYRSTTSGFTPGGGNIVSGATSQTLNDTGLTNGTTYYYKNVVTDNASATATSNQASATPAAGPVTIPTSDAAWFFSPSNWL